MSKEFRFFIYLLERYAQHRGESAADLYDRLEAANLVDYAESMYELYHVESLENAFDDLDRRLSPAALLPPTFTFHSAFRPPHHVAKAFETKAEQRKYL